MPSPEPSLGSVPRYSAEYNFLKRKAELERTERRRLQAQVQKAERLEAKAKLKAERDRLAAESHPPSDTPAQSHYYTSTPAHKRTTALERTATYKHKDHSDAEDHDITRHWDHGLTDGASDCGSDQDAFSTPYWLRGIVRADREERQALGITPKDYGKRWKATFRTITGDCPECYPGDHATAESYWHRIRQAISKGGWSPSEWSALYKLEKVWGDRAHGRDVWFEVMGTRRGRPDSEQQARIDVMRRREELSRIARGEQ